MTQDALEASWTPYLGEIAWHGTNLDAVEGIAAEGIHYRHGYNPAAL